MSVLVKGMKMPDSCYHCKIAESCGHYIANYTDRRHPDCPLIEPERKKGKWINAQYPFSKCSICECYFDTENNIGNYCPNCGAKMEGQL